MSVFDCFSSYAPVHFPSDMSIALSSTDSPWTALVPAIISFLTALIVAVVSLLSARAVIRSTKGDLLRAYHNNSKTEIQLVMSKIFSTSEPKNYNLENFRSDLISNTSTLRFLILEHSGSENLIKVLDQIEDLGNMQLVGWRVKFLEASKLFLEELKVSE